MARYVRDLDQALENGLELRMLLLARRLQPLIRHPQRLDGFSVTAGYSPVRNVHLSIGAEWGDRTSNLTGFDFDYRLISANARIRF